MTERDRELDAIRETYRRYESDGQSRKWDMGNRGFARMTRQRDARVLELLRRSLPPTGGRVLDLGMGDGRLAAMAQEAGVPLGAWSGADLDPKAVASASALFPWATFVEAAADQLPFEAAAFDVVVTATLFSSLPSRPLERAVASEIERVLAPDGCLIWYDLRYGNPANRSVHGLGREDLRSLFPGWTMELESMTLLPPVARRLGPLTGALYGPLHALPFLRSHLIGRLQPPPFTSG